MSARTRESHPPLLRSWLGRGLAASVTVGLATTALIATSPVLAAPAQEDVTWDAVSASLPTADLLDVAFADGGVASAHAEDHADELRGVP